MQTINNDNEEDIIENWDHEIQPHREDNLYKLLEVVASENSRLDIELDDLYDNRFLGSATGDELGKVGDLVGVVRKQGEPDKKLRKRIRGAFAAQASDTSYESFASAALDILDASPQTADFITPPDTPKKVVEIQLDGAVLEENPLTKSELAVLLNASVSADARVQIKETGTFAFAGEDASLEGWDTGTWSTAIK